jgi:hypothetical protein
MTVNVLKMYLNNYKKDGRPLTAGRKGHGTGARESCRGRQNR